MALSVNREVEFMLRKDPGLAFVYFFKHEHTLKYNNTHTREVYFSYWWLCQEFDLVLDIASFFIPYDQAISPSFIGRG
jgi:hypothetical protein